MAHTRTPTTPTTRTRSRRASKAQESATSPGKRIETALAGLPVGPLRHYQERRTLVGKQRKTAFEIMRLRDEGLTCEEIAKRLGYANGTSISRILNVAGKRGWLITPDIEDHLTYVTTHKIVRNIDRGLDEKDGLSQLQQDMTIAAARGRGIFKNHEASKGSPAAASLILGVKIEVAQPGNAAQIGVNSTQTSQLPAETSGVPLYVEDTTVETQPV